jgi:hypothetical protein
MFGIGCMEKMVLGISDPGTGGFWCKGVEVKKRLLTDLGFSAFV